MDDLSVRVHAVCILPSPLILSPMFSVAFLSKMYCRLHFYQLNYLMYQYSWPAECKLGGVQMTLDASK